MNPSEEAPGPQARCSCGFLHPLAILASGATSNTEVSTLQAKVSRLERELQQAHARGLEERVRRAATEARAARVEELTLQLEEKATRQTVEIDELSWSVAMKDQLLRELSSSVRRTSPTKSAPVSQSTSLTHSATSSPISRSVPYEALEAHCEELRLQKRLMEERHAQEISALRHRLENLEAEGSCTTADTSFPEERATHLNLAVIHPNAELRQLQDQLKEMEERLHDRDSELEATQQRMMLLEQYTDQLAARNSDLEATIHALEVGHDTQLTSEAYEHQLRELQSQLENSQRAMADLRAHHTQQTAELMAQLEHSTRQVEALLQAPPLIRGESEDWGCLTAGVSQEMVSNEILSLNLPETPKVLARQSSSPKQLTSPSSSPISKSPSTPKQSIPITIFNSEGFASEISVRLSSEKDGSLQGCVVVRQQLEQELRLKEEELDQLAQEFETLKADAHMLEEECAALRLDNQSLREQAMEKKILLDQVQEELRRSLSSDGRCTPKPRPPTPAPPQLPPVLHPPLIAAPPLSNAHVIPVINEGHRHDLKADNGTHFTDATCRQCGCTVDFEATDGSSGKQEEGMRCGKATATLDPIEKMATEAAVQVEPATGPGGQLMGAISVELQRQVDWLAHELATAQLLQSEFALKLEEADRQRREHELEARRLSERMAAVEGEAHMSVSLKKECDELKAQLRVLQTTVPTDMPTQQVAPEGPVLPPVVMREDASCKNVNAAIEAATEELRAEYAERWAQAGLQQAEQEQELQRLVGRVHELEGELRRYQFLVQDYEGLKEQLEEQVTENIRLKFAKQDLVMTRRQLEEASEKLKHIRQQQHATGGTALADLQREYDAKCQLLVTATSEREALHSELEHTKHHLDRVTSEMANLQQQLDAMSKEKAALVTELNQLRKQTTAATAVSAMDLAPELADLKRQLDEKRAECAQLNESHIRLEQQLVLLKAEGTLGKPLPPEGFEERLAIHAHLHRRELERKEQELRDMREELEKALRQCKSYAEELERFREANEQLAKRNDQFQAIKAKLREQFEVHTLEFQNVALQLEQSVECNHRLRKEIADLRTLLGDRRPGTPSSLHAASSEGSPQHTVGKGGRARASPVGDPPHEKARRRTTSRPQSKPSA